MTTLTKPLTRRIMQSGWPGMIVTLAPEGVYVRQARRRKVYGPLAYGLLALQCIRINIAADEKAKKLARAEKKATRKASR